MKNKNVIELTKPQLKKFWKENSEEIKYYFGRKVAGDIAQFEFDRYYSNQQIVKNYTELNEKGTCKLRQLNRLKYGYNGLGSKLTPGVTGLYSEATLHDKDTTNDHLFGVTAVGWKIHNIIKDLYEDGRSQRYIVDYMTEQWLPKNLHLWVCVKITKQEHKSDNLARDKHTLEEKEWLVHYNEANIEILVKE